jgi:hypothetical protein
MVIMDKFKVSFADSNGRRAALELCCFSPKADTTLFLANTIDFDEF